MTAFHRVQRHISIGRRACTILFICLWVLVFVYFLHDHCDGQRITSVVCSDYARREVAGDLCASLCRERTVQLSRCVGHGEQRAFLWDQNVVRVPPDILLTQGEVTLTEGMQSSKFFLLIVEQLQYMLSPEIDASLVWRLKNFADFNRDDKLSFGEAQSLWRLLRDPEFLVLFIFQHSYAIPRLESTCGGIFMHSYPKVNSLYDKHLLNLHLLSSSAYRWFLPSWEQRAKVSVDILHLTHDLQENSRMGFVWCDVVPGGIGYTTDHSALLTDVASVIAPAFVQRRLENQTCRHDRHCSFLGHCVSTCDLVTQRCTVELIRPTLWRVCRLLAEYLMADAPSSIRGQLMDLLNRCSRLVTHRRLIDVNGASVLNELKVLLWDRIKHVHSLW